MVSRLGEGSTPTGPLVTAVTAFYLILAVALVPRYSSPPASLSLFITLLLHSFLRDSLRVL